MADENGSMKLSEFVASTLEQIAEGVTQAAKAVEGAGGEVNPPATAAGDLRVTELERGEFRAIQMVEFDASLSVTDSRTVGVSGGITGRLPGLGGRAGAEKGDHEESMSSGRISFAVPMVLPGRGVPPRNRAPS